MGAGGLVFCLHAVRSLDTTAVGYAFAFHGSNRKSCGLQFRLPIHSSVAVYTIHRSVIRKKQAR